jgi:hypothetical protein
VQGCGSYDGGDDSDGRKKRMSVVNPNPYHSIYRGGPPGPPVAAPYGAHHSGSILIISRGDHAGFFAKRMSNDLSSEFRSSNINNITGSSQ